MVQNLKLTATMIGIASIATTISSLLIQRRIGKMADRWGPRRVQMLSMLLIPIAPMAWMFVTQFWHVIAVNAVSGALWGAFNLVSFNLLLSVTPDLLRARYAALFQISITLALAGGAAFGTFIITNWGYHSVFLFSAIGRIIAALLFVRFIPDLHVDRP
jgi:MFS family permease